jgi:hypothetical protein
LKEEVNQLDQQRTIQDTESIIKDNDDKLERIFDLEKQLEISSEQVVERDAEIKHLKT